jgi:xylulokinase
MPLVLGVESSTRSTTVELRDSDDGRLFGSGRAHHAPAHSSSDRVSEDQDPNEWWQALVDARRDAGGALGVAAVAAAAQSHAMVALDREGRVIRPAMLWGHTSGAPDAAALVDALGGPEEWAHACGSVPSASFALAKLAWLRRCEPDAYARIAHVTLAPDWLTLRLSRQLVTDRGSASETGYYSPREQRWCPELLELVDDRREWGQCLPRLGVTGEPAGDREGVMIAPGTGHSMAGALGLGVRPRDVVVSLEPHPCVYTVRERPTEDPSGYVAGLADAAGRFLPRVDTPDLLPIVDTVMRMVGSDASRFDRAALDAPPGAGGLVFVPGARRAGAGSHGTGGALVGMTADISSELVARAVIEGVVCSLLDGIDALRHADVPVGGRLFLLGAGAGTHALQRILADLSGRVVGVPQGDRVATGACVQAAATLHGAAPDAIVDAWGLERVREIEPDPRADAAEIRAAYRAARQHGWDRGAELVEGPQRCT